MIWWNPCKKRRIHQRPTSTAQLWRRFRYFFQKSRCSTWWTRAWRSATCSASRSRWWAFRPSRRSTGCRASSTTRVSRLRPITSSTARPATRPRPRPPEGQRPRYSPHQLVELPTHRQQSTFGWTNWIGGSWEMGQNRLNFFWSVIASNRHHWEASTFCGWYRSTRHQFSMDEDDELLQFAIQKSLIEAGTESDQVDIWEALKGQKPSRPSTPQPAAARGSPLPARPCSALGINLSAEEEQLQR